MSPDEKMKKAPRKHVTTACVPCRESKIRVCARIFITGEIGEIGEIEGRTLTRITSATELLRIARIASAKAKNANTNMAMISASESSFRDEIGWQSGNVVAISTIKS